MVGTVRRVIFFPKTDKMKDGISSIVSINEFQGHILDGIDMINKMIEIIIFLLNIMGYFIEKQKHSGIINVII